MLSIVAFLLLAAQPVSIPAHNWFLLPDEVRQRVWMDLVAPEIRPGVRQTWMKVQLHRAPEGTYTISESEIDCTNRRWRDVEETYYEAHLRTETDRPLRGWDDLPENGFIRDLYEKLCPIH